jgi:hypothetical protein
MIGLFLFTELKMGKKQKTRENLPQQNLPKENTPLSDYTELPDEIWYCILRKLDIVTLFKCQSVCKRILDISSSMEEFTKFNSNEWNIEYEAGMASIVNRYGMMERTVSYIIIGKYSSPREYYGYVIPNVTWFKSFTPLSFQKITELDINLDIGSIREQLSAQQKNLTNLRKIRIFSDNGNTIKFLSETQLRSVTRLSVCEYVKSTNPYPFSYSRNLDNTKLLALTLVLPNIHVNLGKFPALEELRAFCTVFTFSESVDVSKLKVFEAPKYTTSNIFVGKYTKIEYYSATIPSSYVELPCGEHLSYLDLRKSLVTSEMMEEISKCKSLSVLRMMDTLIDVTIEIELESVQVPLWLKNLNNLRELELCKALWTLPIVNYMVEHFTSLVAITAYRASTMIHICQFENLEFIRLLPRDDIHLDVFYDSLKLSLPNLKCLDIRRFNQVNCKRVHKENAFRRKNKMNIFEILFPTGDPKFCDHKIHREPPKRFSDYKIFHEYSDSIKFPVT